MKAVELFYDFLKPKLHREKQQATTSSTILLQIFESLSFDISQVIHILIPVL